MGAKGLLLAAAACVALSGAALARELSVEELAELERLLAELNFDPGKIDGVVDARTRTAVGLYQEFAALPVDGTPSATLLAELRQVVQAFADMKAAQATDQAEAAPPAVPEMAPAVAEAPQPAEPEPEPEVAESPPADPEPEVAEAPQPAEPEPEEAEAPPAEPELEEAEAPQPAAPEPEEAEAPQPAALEHEHEAAETPPAEAAPEVAEAPPSEPEPEVAEAPEESKFRFDLDNMIARLVRPDGRAAAGNRADPGLIPPAQVPLGGVTARDGTGERTSRAPPALKFPAASGPVGDGYDAFKKGYAAALAGNFDLAIDFYTRAIEGGDLALTHLADAFYNRANARFYKGAIEFAIADYGSAIVNKPEFPSAYYNRGFALKATGQRTRALADSMRARALGLRRLGVRSPDVPPPRP
ncbi:MAG: peptidoglycan-binding protein [Proteobacteria bacterium]|nr:peptidoglycan-binding protein [Pseudomonadota bacterium]